jgi:chromosome partitioning protein
MDKPIVISMVNQKGGVGKTISTLNVAAIVSDHIDLVPSNKKVLIIDMDPQNASISGRLLLTPLKKNEHTVYHELINISGIMKIVGGTYKSKFSKLIKPTYKSKLDIIPSNLLLDNFNVQVINSGRRELLLKKLITDNLEYLKDYQYIFIDCPPSQSLLSLNAIVASDYIMIPNQSNNLSVDGLDALLETLKETRSNYNTNTIILCAFFTSYVANQIEDTEVFNDFKNSLKEYFWAENTIRRSAAISRAFGREKKSIVDVDPNSKGAQDYLRLVNRIVRETLK